MALEMKPSCESCERVLTVDAEAYICSYECTFCRLCAYQMHRRCPSCGGELVLRPRRDPPPSAA